MRIGANLNSAALWHAPWPNTPISYIILAWENKEESLFYLTMPLEHIDFHIIGYWTSNIWSLWHFSWGNPLPPHRLLFPISNKASFTCAFPQTGQHISQPLIEQFCRSLVGPENSPNCKCIHCAGSIGSSKPSEVGAPPPELWPIPIQTQTK